MASRGHLLERPAAPAVQFEEHLGLVELLVPAGRRVLELVAGEEGVLLEHVELPVEAAAQRQRVHSPLQTDVPGQRPLELRQRQEGHGVLHLRGVHVVADLPLLSVRIAAVEQPGERSQVQLLLLLLGLSKAVGGDRLSPFRGRGTVPGPDRIARIGEEQVFDRGLFGLRHLGFGAHLPDRLLSESRHDGAVQTRQCLFHLGGRDDQLPLEVRLPVDDLLGPFLVVQPGELHDDAVAAALLDQRLLHSECVDPCAQDLQAAVDRVLAEFVGEAPVRVVDLQHEVHPALEVEAQLEPSGPQVVRGKPHHRENDDDPAPE